MKVRNLNRYCQILDYIANHEDSYNSILAKKFKVKPTTFISSLKNLESKGLIYGKRKNDFNIKAYRITIKGSVFLDLFAKYNLKLSETQEISKELQIMFKNRERG